MNNFDISDSVAEESVSGVQSHFADIVDMVGHPHWSAWYFCYHLSYK